MTTIEAGADGSDVGELSWLLRVEDAARLLKISRSKIYEMMNEGGLPSIRVDGCRRIKTRELWQWLEAQGK